MNKLTILLVEDDPQVCKTFAESADKMNNLSIVSITNNAIKALQDIQKYLPNAIILDLELPHGNGTGIDILYSLKEIHLAVNPYILIISNDVNSITYEYAHQLGADFIMSKSQDGYSEKGVLDFLYGMKSIIQHKEISTTFSQTTESPELHSRQITRRIVAELNGIGISPKAVGYYYLIDSIRIVMDKPTQNICSIIAQKYNKTECSVERAMQNAISRAWKQTDMEDLLKYYTAKIHSEKGRPTITEFIYFYANKLKNE